MRRVPVRPRPDLEARATELGFTFLTIEGEVYWDESAYYALTLQEIERDLEAPSAELAALCLELVDRAVKDEALLTRLKIPSHAWDQIAASWQRRDLSLYGRFDFAYDGRGPAKLLEYNADTPTAVYEAAVFQWVWLEDSIAAKTLPQGADQFNSMHDKLIARWREIGGRALHLCGMLDSTEDRCMLAYLEDCARQAGLRTTTLQMEQIGVNTGRFVDLADRPIERLFKLYPWEWMWADAFGRSPAMRSTLFVEPPWKAILSNKGMLPLLWKMAPSHPNLLPAYFEDDPRKFELGARFARKPLYSREGANVMLVDQDRVVDRDEGPYGAEGYIRQALAALPNFGGNYPVIGSWIVGDAPAGIGIREDLTPITKNTSRFMPHAIID